jgi:hypothetical protein
MKTALALTALMTFSTLAVAQEYQCVTVPNGNKLVTVPWWVPADQLIYKMAPAREVKTDDEPCLVVGPSTECTK